MEEQERLTAQPCGTDQMVTLVDQEGRTYQAQLLDVYGYGGENYAVFLPQEEDGEVVIMHVVDRGGERTYESTEDMEALGGVYDLFREKFADQFDFTD